MQKLALVGLGASGLFALKELAGANVEVHVFDVGPTYDKRYPCPIDQGKLEVCPPKACSYCAPGQSAGSWNDFKVILSASPVIGGRLYDLIGEAELQKRTGMQGVVFEPCGNRPDSGDYMTVMKANIARLRQALAK